VPHPLLGTVHGASAQGRPSRSYVRVLERRESAPALVEVAIETDRPHRTSAAMTGHSCRQEIFLSLRRRGHEIPGTRTVLTGQILVARKLSCRCSVAVTKFLAPGRF
jgi:hypothetical protein